MIRKLVALVIISAALMFAGCSDDECPTCNQSGPVMTLNKHKVDFGANGSTATLVISNEGSGDIAWDLQIGYRFANAKLANANHGGWLGLSTASGENDATVTLTADREELDEIGNSRAVITINGFVGEENVARDSVDVYILNSGVWLVTDDGVYEECTVVELADYYWVKGFEMPHGQEHVFIDSISLNFCSGNEDIQLALFDAQFNDQTQTYFPNALLVQSGVAFVDDGWNTFAPEWYVPHGPRFYVGYFQPGVDLPNLSIDATSDNDTLCFRLRNIHTFPHPDSVLLQWQWNGGAYETFAIQVFVSPVIEYNPKLAAQYLNEGLLPSLKTGHAYQGRYPMSVQPQLTR